MPNDQRLKGFLPPTAFAMARLRSSHASPSKILVTSPQPAITLFGRGNQSPELLLIGESFSAEADALLQKMIEAMGVKVSDVFVAQIQAQASLEKAHFDPFAPKLIVSLGQAPTILLLGNEVAWTDQRGKLHTWSGYPLLVSHSPEFLLKNAAAKKEAWSDLKFAMKHLKWKN